MPLAEPTSASRADGVRSAGLALRFALLAPPLVVAAILPSQLLRGELDPVGLAAIYMLAHLGAALVALVVWLRPVRHGQWQPGWVWCPTAILLLHSLSSSSSLQTQTYLLELVVWFILSLLTAALRIRPPRKRRPPDRPTPTTPPPNGEPRPSELGRR